MSEMLKFANKKCKERLKNFQSSKVDESLLYGMYLFGFNDGIEYVQKKFK
jgi:hypothetical protein